MKVEKYDEVQGRTILTSMIVHKDVLASVVGKWKDKGLFEVEWFNLVGGWCVDFYKKCGKAPEQSIENLFASWADSNPDRNTIELVDRFLTGLSGEYKQLRKRTNPDFVCDVAATYFSKIAYSRLASALKGCVDTGKLAKARTLLDKFSEVDIGIGAGIDVFNDLEKMRSAFDLKESEPLIKLPGDLGKFFGSSLERDAFVAVLGPVKRSKTFFLLELAWQAALQQKKVAFFEVGDLSERQILRRFGIRAARRPWRPTQPDKPVRYPKKILLDGEKGNRSVREVLYKEKHFDTHLDGDLAYKKCQELIRDRIKSWDTHLRLSCHPANTLSVMRLESILQTWQRLYDGWSPDLIVTDYADIMAAPPGIEGRLEQVNSVWTDLRALAQKKHALVLTATQANAASFKMDRLDRSNFSENKLKHAHVSGMFALGQSATEKIMVIVAINWTDLREDEFSERDCVFVAQCLAVANPMVIASR